MPLPQLVQRSQKNTQDLVRSLRAPRSSALRSCRVRQGHRNELLRRRIGHVGGLTVTHSAGRSSCHVSDSVHASMSCAGSSAPVAGSKTRSLPSVVSSRASPGVRDQPDEGSNSRQKAG